MLDIHAHNGQLALQAAGLYEAFRGLVHPGGQALRVLDCRGNVLLDQPDDGTGNRPEVPRGELRRLLLDSLPAGTVCWGHKVAAVAPLDGGRHVVTFTNASTVTTNVLVGADGAWSKVRPLLSEAKPAYVGITFIETYLHESDARHRASAQAVGSGSLFALAPGRAIQTHREREGVLHTYVALKKPRDWMDGIDFTDRTAALACVAGEFDGWAPELRTLITESDTRPVPRPIHALPAGHRWSRVPGVTLLGDAAHLMAPSGEGANLAMYDGAELGMAIIAHPGDVEGALLAYERGLFTRSASEAAEAETMLHVLYGDYAPQSLIDFFAGHQPGE